MRLPVVITEARRCVACEPDLPLGARPLIQGSSKSRILIIGQAPGKAAHETGIPWDDRSGARLREWLGMSDEQFYDPAITALMPMGFCYPGTGKTGDMAPRPECAPLWHSRMLKAFRGVELTVITGKYAFDEYLGEDFGTISEAAKAFKTLLPDRLALPHPSPRNNLWLKKNPWFEAEALPAIRRRVKKLVQSVP